MLYLPRHIRTHFVLCGLIRRLQLKSTSRKTFMQCLARAISPQTPKQLPKVSSHAPLTARYRLSCRSAFFCFVALDVHATNIAMPMFSPHIPILEQQQRYAALIKEQDSERMMDDGFMRSGAGNP
jgi:hypothetical protein